MKKSINENVSDTENYVMGDDGRLRPLIVSHEELIYEKNNACKQTKPKVSTMKVSTAVIIIILLLIWGQLKDNAPEPNQYCDMVELGIESGGEYGWPDYKNIYNTECKTKEEK